MQWLFFLGRALLSLLSGCKVCSCRGCRLGTLRKLDGNATTAAKTIWLKQVIVKKVCLLLSIVRSQYSLRRNNASLHDSNEFY